MEMLLTLLVIAQGILERRDRHTTHHAEKSVLMLILNGKTFIG